MSRCHGRQGAAIVRGRAAGTAVADAVLAIPPWIGRNRKQTARMRGFLCLPNTAILSP